MNCTHPDHESLDYLFNRIGQKLNELSRENGVHMSAIFLNREDCEDIIRRVRKKAGVRHKAEVALGKIAEREAGTYTITLTLEV